MLRMLDPAHPGELLKLEVLASHGLSVTAAATILGVGRQSLSAMLNGNASLTPDMALRFEKAFGVSMELLLKMQLQHDVALMRKAGRHLKVLPFKPAA